VIRIYRKCDGFFKLGVFEAGNCPEYNKKLSILVYGGGGKKIHGRESHDDLPAMLLSAGDCSYNQ
jgi:hypothetical protein